MRQKNNARSDLLAKALKNPLDKNAINDIAYELETNPRYSLEIDPTGELKMTQKEKDFTKWYIEHRNVAVAAQIAGIPVDDALMIYRSFGCQSEISRINMAWKLRQINASTLSLEQIGSVLTSYVFDQMPEAEKLSTKDKMTAMKMIIDIHALKQKVVNEAEPIEVDVEEEIKDMSVDALKSLIERTKNYDSENDEKENLIKQIDDESMLSNDDLHYLRSLSVAQLKSLLQDKEEAMKKAKEDEEAAKKKREANTPAPTLTPVDETDHINSDTMTGD